MTPASSSSALATKSTIQIEKIQDNVPIAQDKFVRPKPKAPVKTAN